MAVGNTDIALFGTVAAELSLTGTPMKMTDLYACAWTAGQASSGSFHNYNNLGVAASDSFVTSIWNNSATGASNKGLSNWEGYAHDHNVIISITVADNTGFGVDAQIEIYLDTTFNTTTTLIYNNNMTGGTTISDPNYDSSYPANSNFYNGGLADGYFINVRVILNNGPSPCYINFTANDVDSVGAGTVRETYTSYYGTNTYDLQLNGMQFVGTAACRDYFPSTTKGVYWNKRTDFRITFD